MDGCVWPNPLSSWPACAKGERVVGEGGSGNSPLFGGGGGAWKDTTGGPPCGGEDTMPIGPLHWWKHRARRGPDVEAGRRR